MNTKTRGDVLAERIDWILETPDEHYHSRIKRALAEYRTQWTLGRTVNGFTLGEGQEWHRTDWTEDMLPEGWRPRLVGEGHARDFDCKHDEGEHSTWGTWHEPGNFTDEGEFFFRTLRPIPATEPKP
jgi:hypothetical protein